MILDDGGLDNVSIFASKVGGELTKNLTKIAIHDLPDYLESVLNR